MKGWEEGGEEANVESSVRRRLVGVREEEEVEVLLVLDMFGVVVLWLTGVVLLFL